MSSANSQGSSGRDALAPVVTGLFDPIERIKTKIHEIKLESQEAKAQVEQIALGISTAKLMLTECGKLIEKISPDRQQRLFD